MAEDLVSIHDIAKQLDVDIVQVYKWISTRKMPSHLVGGTWMFSRAEIETWLDGEGMREEVTTAARASKP